MIPNAWTGFDFGLGRDVDVLRDTVARFAQDKIAPRAEDVGEVRQHRRRAPRR